MERGWTPTCREIEPSGLRSFKQSLANRIVSNRHHDCFRMRTIRVQFRSRTQNGKFPDTAQSALVNEASQLKFGCKHHCFRHRAPMATSADNYDSLHEALRDVSRTWPRTFNSWSHVSRRFMSEDRSNSLALAAKAFLPISAIRSGGSDARCSTASARPLASPAGPCRTCSGSIDDIRSLPVEHRNNSDTRREIGLHFSWNCHREDRLVCQ